MLEERTGGDGEEAGGTHVLHSPNCSHAYCKRLRLDQGLPTAKLPGTRPQGCQGSQAAANPIGSSSTLLLLLSECGVLHCAGQLIELTCTETIQLIWMARDGTR